MFGFEFLNYAPPECINPDATFYTRLALHTLLPVGVLPLLCGIAYLTSKKGARRNTSIRYSIAFIELILTSVSITIFRTFACMSFDNGEFLVEQLTLECDDSSERKFWEAYASICVLIYPVGVPALATAVLYYYRAQIKTAMRDLKSQSLGRHAPHRFATVASEDEALALVPIARLFEDFVRARRYARATSLTTVIAFPPAHRRDKRGGTGPSS